MARTAEPTSPMENDLPSPEDESFGSRSWMPGLYRMLTNPLQAFDVEQQHRLTSDKLQDLVVALRADEDSAKRTASALKEAQDQIETLKSREIELVNQKDELERSQQQMRNNNTEWRVEETEMVTKNHDLEMALEELRNRFQERMGVLEAEARMREQLNEQVLQLRQALAEREEDNARLRNELMHSHLSLEEHQQHERVLEDENAMLHGRITAIAKALNGAI